ncbi:MAG: ATP-dependent 6-phosphofructokinase [Acidimicrobiia bacterium]|nr:ATP-dependent 6-phosphofructokinase [Acidimicrobiia bacterium]
MSGSRGRGQGATQFSGLRPPAAAELRVDRLGERSFRSPLAGVGRYFVDDDERVLVSARLADLDTDSGAGGPAAFEVAGPREDLFFDPSELVCGIVTCGGLCPGLNNVIRSLVMVLRQQYRVAAVYGFRYGYAGVVASSPVPPLLLDEDAVDRIHLHGGTMLGSSRGPQDIGAMVDNLARLGVRALFTIGGDGTQRGAAEIAQEARRRGIDLAVIGIPKTIDNDVAWVERSFGFQTAVAEADRVIDAAHVEAGGVWNGVSIVRLMGRHAGYIAAHATLANNDVNYCLVPEVPFALDGADGLLASLEQRLAESRHAVIVVAEGAGQELFEGRSAGTDRSGNARLFDIGVHLRDRVVAHAAERGHDWIVRYLDPSYAIRSLPANASDAEFCFVLGQHAAHAALAGRTNVVIGFWNQRFTHVPLPLVTGGKRRITVGEPLWDRVLEATGQPTHLGA